jgi:hypothetical protein
MKTGVLGGFVLAVAIYVMRHPSKEQAIEAH